MPLCLGSNPSSPLTTCLMLQKSPVPLSLHFFFSWDVTELIVSVHIKVSCELKHATWVLAVIMSRTRPEGLKLPQQLRKWPICIATWIGTVIDFDWD